AGGPVPSVGASHTVVRQSEPTFADALAAVRRLFREQCLFKQACFAGVFKNSRHRYAARWWKASAGRREGAPQMAEVEVRGITSHIEHHPASSFSIVSPHSSIASSQA
ncbi:MAG: hypothetical protein ACYC26_17745, partial [Phycisphaerales bacterium]